jgi:hypothetical protein
MAGDWGRVMNVVAQEGDRVLLSFPMDGFPEGFTLRPGERVVLVDIESDLAVKPLVREFRVDDISDVSAASMSAGDERYALQGGTIRDDEGHGGPYLVTVVDAGSAEGPEQVLAIRPAEDD